MKAARVKLNEGEVWADSGRKLSGSLCTAALFSV